jgi:hypothetical protein
MEFDYRSCPEAEVEMRRRDFLVAGLATATVSSVEASPQRADSPPSVLPMPKDEQRLLFFDRSGQ